MSIIWLLLAFGLGLAAKQFRLPPMLGYLFAGFLLHALGYQKNDAIDTLADTGITLMLFTIGLKVNLKELMRPAIDLGNHLRQHAGLVRCSSAPDVVRRSLSGGSAF